MNNSEIKHLPRNTQNEVFFILYSLQKSAVLYLDSRNRMHNFTEA